MTETKSRRGFASMDPEKCRAIQSMGGRSVPREKRAYFRDRELASEAGRLGGMIGKERREAAKNTEGP